MKAHWGGLARLWLGACALLATRAALAVNDLPGGPGVNQLDLHEPVTQIARDERWLQGVMQQINADAEMAIIGRYFDATIAFTFGAQRFDLIVAQGRVAEIR